MQGTVKEYDQATGSGSLLTDDREEIAIDARSASAEAYQSLRAGQRMRFDVTEEGGRRIARDLRVVTFEA